MQPVIKDWYAGSEVESEESGSQQAEELTVGGAEGLKRASLRSAEAVGAINGLLRDASSCTWVPLDCSQFRRSALEGASGLSTGGAVTRPPKILSWPTSRATAGVAGERKISW